MRPDAPARRPAWAWFLGVAVLGVAGYGLIPTGVPRDATYVAFGLASVVAVEVGIRLHRPARTAPWHLIALGTLLWSSGDALGAWFADVAHVTTFPTPADAVYLLGYGAIGDRARAPHP